jgi:hypothetical protein
VLPARFAVPRERVHCRRGVEDEYNSLILARLAIRLPAAPTQARAIAQS